MANYLEMTDAQLDALALERGVSLEGCTTKYEKVAELSDADRAASEPVAFEAMGVSGVIDAAVFDDLDVLECLERVQDGDVLVYPKLFKAVFGDDWQRIRKELGAGGRLSTTRASLFFTQVMEAATAKN